MPPRLESVLTLHLTLGPNQQHMKSGRSTERMISPISGGYIRGPGIDMQIASQGGADWFTLDTTNSTGYVDVRVHATDKTTGSSIYVHYPGVMRVDAKIQAFFENSPEAKTTESKDHYFFSTPIFEVSGEEHKWLEQTVFVGHGHFVKKEGLPGYDIEYEVYKAVSG